MYDISINLYKTFCVVAQSKNYVDASNKLHISTTAISKNIRQLESLLGTTLFYREKDGVKLTGAGQEFFKYAEQGLATLNLGEKLIMQKSDLATGEIAIGCPSHLTTFYHAKQNNIKEFWNIDADDTMFALEPEDIMSILQNVENYSKTNNIDAMSLDMWHSRTRQRHWSFGITYINNFSEIFNILDSLTNTDWQNNYKDCDVAFNLDWFFTYLKDEKKYGKSTDLFFN